MVRYVKEGISLRISSNWLSENIPTTQAAISALFRWYTTETMMEQVKSNVLRAINKLLEAMLRAQRDEHSGNLFVCIPSTHPEDDRNLMIRILAESFEWYSNSNEKEPEDNDNIGILSIILQSFLQIK